MNVQSSHIAMSCPTCAVPLVMSERQGIEIDYCPQCRGIWLDRGELDKIIDRAGADAPAAAPAPVQAQPAPQPAPAPQMAPAPAFGHAPPAPGYGHYPPQHSYGHQPHYYKRRKHWLEEIFD